MTINYETSYTFSSSPENGALNINANGSAFTVDMSRFPIAIPESARTCTIRTIGASIPYVSPNIEEGINSEFYFTYNGNAYQITLPSGLYSLNDINSAISLGLQNIGPAVPSNLFSFIGNNSTQRVSILFNYPASQIDFTPNDTFRTLLGFDAVLVPPLLSVAGQNVTAPNIAAFDSLQSFVIVSNIINSGIPFNNIGRNVIALIPISNVQVGQRIAYDPQQVIKIAANELIGQRRTSTNWQILDQLGRPINMLNQAWSVTITIAYEV